MCDTNVCYVTSHLFLFFVVKREPEELDFEAKNYFY